MKAFAPSTVAHAERQASGDVGEKESTHVLLKTHPSRHVPSSTHVTVGAEEGSEDGDGLGLPVVVGTEDGAAVGDRLGKSVESHLPPTVAFSKE